MAWWPRVCHMISVLSFLAKLLLLLEMPPWKKQFHVVCWIVLFVFQFNLSFCFLFFLLQALPHASSASSSSSPSNSNPSESFPGPSTSHFSEKFKLPTTEFALPGANRCHELLNFPYSPPKKSNKLNRKLDLKGYAGTYKQKHEPFCSVALDVC